MVSIAFYGGVPGGISTPITHQPGGTAGEDQYHTMLQPYCHTNSQKKMAQDSESRAQEEIRLKEDKEAKKEERNWWKMGMLMLCLLGSVGGILWWYEGTAHTQFIGLVAIGGKLKGSHMTGAIECWGSFPGCRPFQQYFSYETNRTIYEANDTVTLLEAYNREVTHMYRTSCVDSDHCQEYDCRKVNLREVNLAEINIQVEPNETVSCWGFQWLECNQTEGITTILVPREEMIQNSNSTWRPKGCNETWARVKHCPMDMLYGIHPIRLCVQPPFFLMKVSSNMSDSSNPSQEIKCEGNTNCTLSNCGPQIFLGVLKDNRAVINSNDSKSDNSSVTCEAAKRIIQMGNYYGRYIVPIFYNCSFETQSCNNDTVVSVIMHNTDNVQYLLCNRTENTNTSTTHQCVVQKFGVIGQVHLQLPRKNQKIENQKFTRYNCSINNQTELKSWKLLQTSGITPMPISSTANTGLVRYKRDFGLSAIVAAIIAATAIAASATMSYIALTEVNKMEDVQNHTFAVENNTIMGMELLEKQVQVLYAMILQTHADVQLLKEKQRIEETFNLIGCIERSHTFCHTGHPWNESWGQLNESTQWDTWVSQMERYSQEILQTLHVARNNLEQSMITFNTPDSIAQFGKDIWNHISNWIPGLGHSIIKYIALFLLLYVVLTSMPKLLRGLLTTLSGVGCSASRYLKNKYHRRRASQEDTWDRDRCNIHLAGVTDGSGHKSKKQKYFRNDWNGESEEYSRRHKNWKKSIREFGENYTTQRIKEGTIQHGTNITANKRNDGENPHQGSLNLKIQSDGGHIHDCCIKAQEGTLAVPCCGFPLWLILGLIIIMGRLIGYGLKGLSISLQLIGKGVLMLINLVKKIFDYFAKALNPPRSHISMPQYV
uniref:Envelope glycoprotein n=1 Tax=Equine infectious anemia virus TaxID=11665 RepID=A0A5J6SF17_9RETR|nr:envelope polyprotein [Equine infectious anemia virus]